MVSRACILLLAACLLAACGSIADDRQGMIAAVAHAIEEARKVQLQLAETGKCPRTLAGWQRVEKGWGEMLEADAGTQKVRYPLALECDKDSEFGILVKYSFDSGDTVSGSATGPLEVTYGHHTAPCTFQVSAADDAVAAATRAVREAADCNPLWGKSSQ
jgi:hypothetical protein